MKNNWQKEHRKVIDSFLKYLNSITDEYILKGGTALLTCYKLDRFSEDIDLDSKKNNLQDIVKNYCKQYDYTYRLAKDTDTVKRCMINYGNDSKPLKVEVSLRRKFFREEDISIINGIKVYNINSLCIMKTNAYSGRDKIRDLYDLTFIVDNYFEQLNPETVYMLQDAIVYKGIEQFDYLVKNQKDELIDSNKLAEKFLIMFDKLELLSSSKEEKIINAYKTPPQKDIFQYIKNQGFNPTQTLINNIQRLNDFTGKFNTLKDIKELSKNKEHPKHCLIDEIVKEFRQQEIEQNEKFKNQQHKDLER